MNKEINYPISYAPYPLYVNEKLYSYVALPCYVIRKIRNNTSINNYEVVFKKDIINNRDIKPKYNKRAECINSKIVHVLDESFDRIKDYCDDENIEIFCNSFSIEKPDYIRKKEMEYQTKINEYYDSLEEEKIKESLNKIFVLNKRK